MTAILDWIFFVLASQDIRSPLGLVEGIEDELGFLFLYLLKVPPISDTFVASLDQEGAFIL
jgi:hypothetical protein